MYEEIYAQAKQACNELCDVAKLKEGTDFGRCVERKYG